MTPTTAIPADLLTPLGAYLRLRGEGGGSFLLESVERGRLGRNSFVGAWRAGRRARGGGAPRRSGRRLRLVRLRREARADRAAAGDGRRTSREPFVVAETLVRFDHGAGVAEVLAGDPEEIAARLAAPLVEPAAPRASRERSSRSPSQERYEEMVRTCQEHIRAGDAYQVVPSQRAERPTSASPLALYRALRRVNPSPYLFLLELGDVALVGSSPERLVACEDGRASVCPIAGTTTPDDGDAERLLSSEKDRAEHVMLVDLGRNDLSRVCRGGTVRVTRFMDVERFSHVSHLVSEVTARLRDGVTPFDVLRACFPAGTVTGAPKVRAMQIISELEGYRRGPYAGAVGYVLPDGTMDTCIALRTIVVADGVARLQAGAGVVADSEPEAEHRECLAKLAALEAAIELAEVEYA